MLGFDERGGPEYPEKNLSGQKKTTTTKKQQQQKALYVSFKWSHLRISSIDSKVRTSLHSVINGNTGKYYYVAYIYSHTIGFHRQIVNVLEMTSGIRGLPVYMRNDRPASRAAPLCWAGLGPCFVSSWKCRCVCIRRRTDPASRDPVKRTSP